MKHHPQSEHNIFPGKNPIREKPNQKVRSMLYSFLLHYEMQVKITRHSLWRFHGNYGQYGFYRVSSL
jgi:hypothetical protein